MSICNSEAKFNTYCVGYCLKFEMVTAGQIVVKYWTKSGIDKSGHLQSADWGKHSTKIWKRSMYVLYYILSSLNK